MSSTSAPVLFDLFPPQTGERRLTAIAVRAGRRAYSDGNPCRQGAYGMAREKSCVHCDISHRLPAPVVAAPLRFSHIPPRDFQAGAQDDRPEDGAERRIV